MRGPAARPVVLAAGGTGGHFFPAEALAQELVARGHRVALLTDARSGGLRSAVFEGREVFVLHGAGLAGRGALRAARAGAELAAGTVQARAILARLGAAAVVGFGGYPCVAPVLAARTVRPRPAVVLHEQNRVLGRANRALCRFADVLALGMEGTEHVPAGVATRVVGNPVRPAIRALAGRGYTPPGDGPVRLLVLGGSLGARVFSDVVPAALAALPPDPRARLRVVQQCRPEDLERVRAAYAEAGITAELDTFFENVSECYDAAHLVVARAGASTVAEVCAIGRPAVLVPLPDAIDGHQSRNARGWGAEVVEQPDFTPERLRGVMQALLARQDRLTAMARDAAGHGRPDAATRLADLVEARMGRANTAPRTRDGTPDAAPDAASDGAREGTQA